MRRSTLIVVALVAAGAVGASAAAAPPVAGAPCAYAKPKPELSRFEREVREGQAFRRGFDLRADRAWVVRVLRSPRARAVDGFGRLSPGERRYFALRGRVSEAADVAAAYLRREAAGVSGGVSIEDDGRRGPFVLVRLTAERAVHEPALRRRFPLPRNLRFADVTYSEQELEALQERISDDTERLEAEGFDVQSLGADVTENRLTVDVRTDRADAPAVFAERYGPAVRLDVVRRPPTELVCTRAEGYSPRDGGRSLVVRWTTNSVYELERIEVDESARAVRIGIVEVAPTGPVTLAAKSVRRRVRLSAPLADRRVVSARTGRRIPTVPRR